MDKKDREIKPSQLPFDLDDIQEKYGRIRCAEEKCPGVYYLRMDPVGDLPVSMELYVAVEKAPISEEVRSFGKLLSRQPG